MKNYPGINFSIVHDPLTRQYWGLVDYYLRELTRATANTVSPEATGGLGTSGTGNLSDDYAFKPGISGGQTLAGGAGSGDSLTVYDNAISQVGGVSSGTLALIAGGVRISHGATGNTGDILRITNPTGATNFIRVTDPGNLAVRPDLAGATVTGSLSSFFSAGGGAAIATVQSNTVGWNGGEPTAGLWRLDVDLSDPGSVGFPGVGNTNLFVVNANVADVAGMIQAIVGTITISDDSGAGFGAGGATIMQFACNSAGTGDIGFLGGVSGITLHESSGTCQGMFGLAGVVRANTGAGDVVEGKAIVADCLTNANIGTYTAFYGGMPSVMGGAAVEEARGIFFEHKNTGINNSWSQFFTGGTGAKSYHGGDFHIGVPDEIFCAPDGTTSAGSWTQSGGGANLHLNIDEEPFDDTDYITSTTNSDTGEVSMNTFAITPLVGDLIHVEFRARVVGAANRDLTVTLREGAGTTIATSTVTVFNSGYTPYAFKLKAGEVAAVTNWADVRLRFITGTLSGDEMRVSYASITSTPFAPRARLHLEKSLSSIASLKIDAGTAPTTQLEGHIWNDSTQKALQGHIDGVEQTLPGVLFTQTATVTKNTNGEATLLSTGIGTTTLPANFFVPGKTLRVTARGNWETGSPIPGQTSRWRLKYGSTTLVDTNTTATTDTVSQVGLWEFSAIITCRTTGATGTVMPIGWTDTSQAVVSTPSRRHTTPLVGTVVIDTTASTALDLTFTYTNIASTSEVDCTNVVIEVLN